MPTGRRGRWWRGAVALVALLAAATTAAGQESLKVTWNAEKGSGGKTRVTGMVVNDGRVDVLDVYVTAEALDAGKKVVARGIAFVSTSIPQNSSAGFSINVPTPPSTAGFRVGVSSFRVGLGTQGP